MLKPEQITQKSLIQPSLGQNLTDEQIKVLTEANLIFYCDDCECYHMVAYPKVIAILEAKERDKE